MARRSTQAPNVLRAALLPLSLALLGVFVYGVGLSLVVATVAVLPLLALYSFAPVWARASARRFDREALRVLSVGEPRELLRLYRSCLGLSLFGPPALRGERRGLVAAETGDPRAARAAFKRAIDAYDRRADVPLSVEIGFAHAAFALREDRLAVDAYERLLGRAEALPRVRQNLAHALIRREARIGDALDLLADAERHAVGVSAGAEIELLRGLAEAKQGRRKAARKRLASVAELEGHDALRAEVEAALVRS
jgi:tetratricopeptide (TPR) repeat protein